MDINIIQSLNPYEVKNKGILKSNRGEGAGKNELQRNYLPINKQQVVREYQQS